MASVGRNPGADRNLRDADLKVRATTCMFKIHLILLVTVGILGSASAQQARYDDVVRNLRNPDPKARMSSISLLRESKYLEAIEPLAPLVNDPLDEIQLAAIDAELSFYLVEDAGARRRYAFIVEVRNAGRAENAFSSGPLATWPRPLPASLAAALLKAVDDENPKVRVEAIYTFGAIGTPAAGEEHAEALLHALDHYDPAIRAAAARVIGRLKVKSAGEALIKAVNDSQDTVRFTAMRALGEIGEVRAIQALTKQLEFYRKGEGAWSALDGLARIGHASSVALFAARLADRDAFVRRAAVEGLARAGASTQVTALETIATSDSSRMVRAAASFALQKLGKNYIARLVEPLDSSSMAPQIAGYFLELGQPAVAPLTSHLKDPDAAIRGNVALILGAIGTSAQVPALEPLLTDRSEEVRRAAERAMQRLKVRGA
jgi:HEAT repeat protein